MNIVVYGSRRQDSYGVAVRQLLVNLALGGATVSVHEKLYDFITRELKFTLPGIERVFACPEKADLALSIGGDGTFLRTVAWIDNGDIPVLGINTGHLGYLTAITIDEALDDTDAIMKLDFRTESLAMLRVEADGIKGSRLALNEVVMAKEDTASMVSVAVTVNGHFMADYKADGLIISTPTGSTAYNLSVGGPIIEPGAPVWVLSPIAAHSLTLRPLVVGNSSDIEVTVTGRGTRFRLVIDGRPTSLPMGTNVRIVRADREVIILRCRDRDFASILGEKLGFNE